MAPPPGDATLPGVNDVPGFGCKPCTRSVPFQDQTPETSSDLFVADLEAGGEPRLVLGTRFEERHPRVSPDGAWIAYTSDETGADEVFLRAADGGPGQIQISRDGGAFPRWTRGGREILYRGGDGQLMAAEVESFSPLRIAEPRALFPLPGEPDRREPVFQDVSGDGQRILLNVPTESRSSVGFRLLLGWTRELAR